MKIQEVQFPLNIGVATELEIQVLKQTENEGSVNVHYSFRDLTKSTVLVNNSELPYKVLHSNNIIVSGQDFNNYKQDESYINTFICSMLEVTPI